MGIMGVAMGIMGAMGVGIIGIVRIMGIVGLIIFARRRRMPARKRWFWRTRGGGRCNDEIEKDEEEKLF